MVMMQYVMHLFMANFIPCIHLDDAYYRLRVECSLSSKYCQREALISAKFNLQTLVKHPQVCDQCTTFSSVNVKLQQLTVVI